MTIYTDREIEETNEFYREHGDGTVFMRLPGPWEFPEGKYDYEEIVRSSRKLIEENSPENK
jgi:hypothetical protein